MSSYDGRERLVLSYEAHGGNALAVLADADRIARSALPEGVEPLVEVGLIRPNLIATDGSGRHEVQRWVADCTATVDVDVPEPTS